MMRLSILSGIAVFVLWCIVDTSLTADHVRNCWTDGKLTFLRTLCVVLVQIVLWTLTGVFAFWVVPHLPSFFITGWRSPFTVFAAAVVQWFALLMVLQHLWRIVRATLSTAFMGVMASLGSQWAKQSLSDVAGWWQTREMENTVGVEQEHSGEKANVRDSM